MHHILMQSFFVKHQITQVTQPLYRPVLVPCDFCLFQKLKSLLKERFQALDDIQEDMMGQLMVTGSGASHCLIFANHLEIMRFH